MNRSIFAGKLRVFKTLAASMTLLALLTAPAAPTWAEAKAETAQQLKEVRDVIQKVHLSGISAADLQADTIEGLIRKLDDPYTEYFDEARWNEFQNSLELNYAGIGMRLGQDEGGFIAVEVFEGSPSVTAGLRRGDYIIAVGGSPTAGMRIDEVTGLIRGAEGTEISIRVKRGDQQLDLTVKRKQIHLPVVSGGMMEGGIGYLNVDSFSEEADEQFAAMLDVLKKAKAKGLVIDLRDNPGGLLETAKHIAEQFISDGVLIHTRDKFGVDEPLYIRSGQSVSFPVIVLVNENSASASEVLTAALQDYHKAAAVGKKTYGKGSVQSLYPLPSGGVLKVTVQEYLSPDKRVVNKVGLMPDIETEGTVPQLLTGLRQAGLNDIRLEADKHSYKVGGFEFFDADLPTITDAGHLYMPARVLAASVGEQLVWNESLHAVEIGQGSAKHLFSDGTGFRNEKGTGFIELSRFKEQYPQIEWTNDAEKTVLTVKGKEM
ncbi:S41 family peptidase [Paenibacillus ginsengarvi]|uniref:S41 family peptidase n=1 Tax=Paenibacillus ginsengarvi TaxID=400777 RepID=A0A3B0CP98_9BACL|nr:S41 family peptidase [Paenibacillus ginsengarvi]RKN86590.1 S41 family peptidase [Paenibacillus ginsengarvi]